MGNPYVLVVDDDPVILRLVCANLRARGLEVITAGDGESALRKIEENPLDLIILDIMMPGINGIEVCQRIRKRSEIPVMMMSARVDEENQATAMLNGATSYLCKPFAIDDLMSRIWSMLS